MSVPLRSLLEGVVHVEVLRGKSAEPEAAPDLLVEVAHGADRRVHYDAPRTRLVGDLARDFHLFEELDVDGAAVEEVAGPLADVIDRWLRQRPSMRA
ncbi:MAG: hypothetical protein JRH11_09430 [Deltaproteobacteria bacterium]|nr:hypothetical protein [Deltaproteobacteria bacterium]